MALNNDGLEANAPVSREDYWRVAFEILLARQMVTRGDQPDFNTALAAVRAA